MFSRDLANTVRPGAATRGETPRCKEARGSMREPGMNGSERFHEHAQVVHDSNTCVYRWRTDTARPVRFAPRPDFFLAQNGRQICPIRETRTIRTAAISSVAVAMSSTSRQASRAMADRRRRNPPQADQNVAAATSSMGNRATKATRTADVHGDMTRKGAADRALPLSCTGSFQVRPLRPCGTASAGRVARAPATEAMARLTASSNCWMP